MAIWIYEGQVRIEYEQALLAQYQGQYDARRRQLGEISQPQVYRTAYVSPQLELWELDDAQWRKMREVPKVGRVRRGKRQVEQLRLQGFG